MAVTAEH